MARLRSQSDILNPTLTNVGVLAGSLSTSETAPANPIVGQRWFKLSTSIMYQYTSDGTTSFWLDITSGGIGTSNYRAVNYVGDADPHPRSNVAGAGVGAVFYNREGNRYFELMDATNNANVWRGSYSIVGGQVHTYVSSNVTYRIHVFWGTAGMHNITDRTTYPFPSNYMLYLDKAQACDVLMVAGGGGGGGEFGGGGAGGGVLYAAGRTIPAGSYPIVVGDGGRNGLQSAQTLYQSLMGGSTSAFGATIHGGGPGLTRSVAWSTHVRTNMANGGGGNDATAGESATATSSSGFVGTGGSFTTSGGYTGGGGGGSGGNYPAGGGAGAAAVGQTPGSTSAASGSGGSGIQVGAGIYDNVNNYWWAGGGGGGGYEGSVAAGTGGAGGGGGGSKFSNGTGGGGHRGGISPGQQGGVGNGFRAGAGGKGTGGGGGGSTHQYGIGGTGGSGIVIVKYAIN